jgi:uncharacterized protein (DUF58 family)
MSELIDHHILMAIKDLSLAARRTIDGFMTGINKSQVKGAGLEFSQYRSYQPGDDLRWLDWKCYARSDRYYIRESEVETGISIRLLIDASRSMEHPDGGFTKIQYARYLAASLGWLAHLQGDSFGLHVFQDGDLFSLPSQKDPQHLARFFHQLENIHPMGRMGSPVNYKHVFTEGRKRELLIFITDLYEEQGEITRLLDLLASLRHEVIVFHIMGRNELEKDFAGYSRVEDLETGAQVVLPGSLSGDGYRENLDKWLSEVRMQLLDRQIAYRVMRMDQPLDQAIRDFLRQRIKTNAR